MHISPLEPLGGVSPRILPSVEHPRKLLKTQTRLCIEFYALFPWFNVGERWSLKPSFLLGFGVTSQDRCAAGFPCVPWFLPITDGVGFRSRFPQLIRAELKRACITQVSTTSSWASQPVPKILPCESPLPPDFDSPNLLELRPKA